MGKDHILPYFAVYHANYVCNAGCRFCSQAANITAGKYQEIPLDEIRRILNELRKMVPSLYIAGGEPLVQRNIEGIVELARALDFWPVAINTNATLLHERPNVLRYADKTVVSIHAVKVAVASDIFQISYKQTERMFANIRDGAIEARRHGNQLVANCVLTADNIRSAHGVLDYYLEANIPLAIVPAVENYWPTIERADPQQSVAYVHFVERVIAQKRKDPQSIQGTLRHLERIRGFHAFQCRPTGMLVVDPHGNILNPCEYKYRHLPAHIGQITSEQDALSILHRALDYATPFQHCPMNCLKACFVEPAMSMEAPLELAMEFLPLAWLRTLISSE